MRPALLATVVITRARHPLEGRDLRVLGWMRRLGRLRADARTARRQQAADPGGADQLARRPGPGSLHGDAGQDSGPAGPVRAGFGAFRPQRQAAGSRLHETRLPGRIIVQPVQLSLLPDQVPAPLPEPDRPASPEDDVAAAVALLAAMIARAHAAATAQEAGDE